MSSQRERSTENFLDEIRELKEDMERALPSYAALLKGLSQLPEEFERRFWASRLEALLQGIRVDYRELEAQARKVDLLGRFMTGGMNIALMAGRMQPVPALPPVRLGISVSPSGKIEPDLIDDLHRQPGTLLIKFEDFERLALSLRDRILKGEIVPTNEDEIPKLIHALASGRG